MGASDWRIVRLLAMALMVSISLTGCLDDARDLVGLLDTDGDGFSDKLERKVGSDPEWFWSTPEDWDGDGLTNEQEETFGTDPRKGDTDEDGLFDSWETIGVDWGRDGIIDLDLVAEYGVDVHTPDIIIRFYFMQGVFTENVAQQAFTYLREEYAENGINMVFSISEIPEYRMRIDYVDAQQLQRDYANRSTRNIVTNGLAVDMLISSRNTSMGDGRTDDGFIIATNDANTELGLAGRASHMMGHWFGATSGTCEGIDSISVSFDEYPSIMNYNAPRVFYGLSNGTNSANDCDDWASLNFARPLNKFQDEFRKEANRLQPKWGE